MKRAGDWLLKLSEAALAAMLAVMLCMVLLNVVMRYAFGTGISATEELSRTLFVWLVFTGAVVATYERAHLGVDSLVAHLPHGGKLACAVISELAVLTCCVLVFYGTWRQHDVNASNRSLTTGMPVIWVFGVGYLASVGIGLLTALRLWRLATSTLPDAELLEVPSQESVVQAAAKGEAAL